MLRIKNFAVLVVCVVCVAFAVNAQEFQKPDPKIWYRLTTMYNGDDDRQGRCIQYFPEGSGHPGLLWSADPVEPSDPSYDYQLWKFVPSEDNPDMYALVCKAAPKGYVSAVPTSYTAQGRWQYVETPVSDNPDDKYDFEFDEKFSGVDAESSESYAAIFTDVETAGLIRYMNCGGADQDYAVNVSSATAPNHSNEWLFRFTRKQQVAEIETIITDGAIDRNASSEIYDLFGRKVTAPGPGIYIVDGRKVIM